MRCAQFFTLSNMAHLWSISARWSPVARSASQVVTMQLEPELEQLQAFQCTIEVEADHPGESEDEAHEHPGHSGNQQERQQQQCRRYSGGAHALFPQRAGQPRLDDAPSIKAGHWQ